MDKAFIKLITSVAKQKEDIDHDILNAKIVEMFPGKEYLREAKNAKNYFNYLVSYMMGIIDKNLLSKVFPPLETIYRKLYDNLSTLDKKLSYDIRVPLFNRFKRNGDVHKLAKKGIKLTYAEKSEVVQKQADSLKAQSSDVNRYDEKEILQIIQTNIDSEDEYKIACALALASGSRPVELFDKEVRFTKLDDHWVRQSHTAKKRGLIVPVEKPIIGISPEKFIRRIDDMRISISKDNGGILFNRRGELKKIVERKANETMKKVLGYVGGITLYSARKIYVDLSYKLYAKGSRVGENPNMQLWVQAVLGHSENDFKSGVHYSNFQAIDNNSGGGESSVALKALEVKVDRLTEIVENKKVIEIDRVPVIAGKKQAQQNDFLEQVKVEYEKHSNITQTELEKALAGQVPRAIVRLWVKQNKEKK